MPIHIRQRGCGLALFALGVSGFLAAPAIAATSLTLSESSGSSGASLSVPLRFASDGDIVAIQLDFAWDSRRAEMRPVLLGDAAPGDFLLDEENLFGKRRMVIYSPTNIPLSDGALLNIPLDLTQDVPEDEAILSIERVVAARADGSEVSASLMPYGRITTALADTLYAADVRDGGLLIEAVAFDTGGGGVSAEFRANGNSFGLRSAAPYAMAWAPADDGAYVISLHLANARGDTVLADSRTLSVEILRQYDEWAERYFGADADNPAIAGPLVKSQGRPVENFFYFAMGQMPEGNPASMLPHAKMTQANSQQFVSLVYQRPRGIEGITYRVEMSTSLDEPDWQHGPGHTAPEEIIDDGVIQTVRVRSASPVADHPKAFMRLVVELIE